MIKLTDGRAALYQWDTGRTVTVSDDVSEVHFQNKAYGRTVNVTVENGIAAIPDEMLQVSSPIRAFEFVGTEESGYTKIESVFAVVARNKPADYVFTPTEQITLSYAIKIAESVRADADAGKFDGATGPQGDKGDKGDKGDTGADGKTPVKGIDYWTPKDQAEIADAVNNANLAANEANLAAGIASDSAEEAIQSRDAADEAANAANAKAAELQAKADAGDFNGKDGKDGTDGYTPVRGTDYWTDADKAEIVAEVEGDIAPLLQQYELLETITLTEDTAQISRSQYTDGSAIALRDLLVSVECAAGTVDANLVIGMYFGSKSCAYSIANGVQIGGKKCCALMANGGRGIYTITIQPSAALGIESNRTATTGFIVTPNNISYIYIKGSTSQPIPAGSVINIYGVKA